MFRKTLGLRGLKETHTVFTRAALVGWGSYLLSFVSSIFLGICASLSLGGLEGSVFLEGLAPKPHTEQILHFNQSQEVVGSESWAAVGRGPSVRQGEKGGGWLAAIRAKTAELLGRREGADQ